MTARETYRQRDEREARERQQEWQREQCIRDARRNHSVASGQVARLEGQIQSLKREAEPLRRRRDEVLEELNGLAEPSELAPVWEIRDYTRRVEKLEDSLRDVMLAGAQWAGIHDIQRAYSHRGLQFIEADIKRAEAGLKVARRDARESSAELRALEAAAASS